MEMLRRPESSEDLATGLTGVPFMLIENEELLKRTASAGRYFWRAFNRSSGFVGLDRNMLHPESKAFARSSGLEFADKATMGVLIPDCRSSLIAVHPSISGM